MMLSDEIAAARLCLRLALDSGRSETLKQVAEGVCHRLKTLEDDTIEWQGATVIAWHARLPDDLSAGKGRFARGMQ